MDCNPAPPTEPPPDSPSDPFDLHLRPPESGNSTLRNRAKAKDASVVPADSCEVARMDRFLGHRGSGMGRHPTR